ncbi:MAG: DEAD/DEAH box helicase [Candidatus Omnitrophica bacterium]|nr:DEAD/DEAH box helicase [Candidatus Omnitrophota bacterium]
MLEKFEKLGLSKNALLALEKKGFEEPTEIQEKVIPLLLNEDVDVIGQAQTGTGKTAAFGLPMIEKLDQGAKKVQALILVPTRELALQVAEEINSLKGQKRVGVIAIYGGQSIDQQLRRLRKGVEIVVGTPGRIKDHLGRKSLKVDQITYMVLDEVDEMLNMGFIDDVEEILSHTSQDKRMLLFSATMPDRILRLVKKYMSEYKLVRTKKSQETVSLTDQIYFEVAHADRLEALCRLIDSEENFYGLIFCRTKIDVDELYKKLSDRGYDAEGLHGDMSQNMRERIFKRFKDQKINILVATDVAARGIDINDLTHVINFSLPQNLESYIHRIGRTGRAGKEGTAVTFVTPDEYRKIAAIRRITKTDIRKEKIPAIGDVINSKKARIRNDINNVIQASSGDEFIDFASEMLENNDPEKVLAAVIKCAFSDELSRSSYNEIRDVSINTKGVTRLFVAKGKIDGVDPRKLISMIKDTSKVDSNRIRDVRIFDRFSFITVPFEEAEIILRAFKKKKIRQRPIIERAKSPKDSKQRKKR